MNRESRLYTLVRAMAAIALASAVAGVGVYFARETVRNTIVDQDMFTQMKLKGADSEIRTYRRKHGTLPRSLRQLRAESGERFPTPDDTVFDSWGNPVAYEAHGNTYRLVSYGLDGKPGGVGLDYDLTTGNPRQPDSPLPFLQVFSLPTTTGMLWSTLLCSMLTLALTFWMVQPSDFHGPGVLLLTAKLIGTLAASVVGVTFLTLLWGHPR